MDRDQRLADYGEGGGIRARSPLPQRHDRQEAEDAHGDEGGFDEAGRDKAEGEDFVLPLEDRKQREGGADVGDDEEHLQERSQQHAGVGAGTGDVAGVVEHGGVEHEECGDRREVGDEEEHARHPGQRLRIQLRSLRGAREALLEPGNVR